MSIRAAARSALLWGVGFTSLRDVLQFFSMLILVRILTPHDYGRVALAQTLIGLLSILSIKTFVANALQARDPARIDWDAQFTLALTVNLAMFAATLAAAGVLSLIPSYGEAALPLAVLSVVFLIEIPANLRGTQLQVTHNWPRYQILLMVGIVAGNVLAILIALTGGGYWALVAGAMTTGVPMAVDFVMGSHPRLVRGWDRQKGALTFGASRVASAGINSSRQTIEQMTLVGTSDFAALGIFTRSIGLATLAAGRVGGLVMAALYPAITRAEASSAQFRRVAAVSLRGIVWVTIPSAAFLALTAPELVHLLYGPKWPDVIQLLPLAAGQTAAVGIGSACYGLLLANQNLKACLVVDVVSGSSGIVLALLVIPLGLNIYLAALLCHGLVVLTLILFQLRRHGGIDAAGIFHAILPPLAAAAAGAAAVTLVTHSLPMGVGSLAGLAVKAASFTLAVLAVFRFGAARQLSELLEAAPGGRRLSHMLRLA